jgi:phosphoribosylformimino-5-aminoimidazole carboxamide ribotide isomerase
MKIIPVLDLMGGRVVRGIRGRRDEYRPIVSALTSSCQPIDVAVAFRDHFGLFEIYVADLDAIGGARPSLGILDELRSAGFSCWVDAGIRDVEGALALAEHVEAVVGGLETLPAPQAWEEISQSLGNRAIFSLDTKDGVPLGNTSSWGENIRAIADKAVELGTRRLLLLDLGRVGAKGGTGSENDCARITSAHPQLELLVGGGVRGKEDLQALRQCGVSAVLIASALHDGDLRPQDLLDTVRTPA